MSQVPLPYRELQQKVSSLTNDDTFDNVSDASLIISITSRLTALEKQTKTLKNDLADKDNQIDLLTTYKSDLESVLYDHPDEPSLSLLNKVEQLQKENTNCKRQITEMALFLADYGMEWVGYHYDQNNQESASNHDIIATKQSKNHCVYFNISIMLQRIKELNSLINYQHIAKNERSNVYHFTSPPSISITFYTNGIFLKNGPLRTYELTETKQFLRDILDGYFPSELKEEYPNGVMFNATDCSNQICDTNTINVNAAKLISKLSTKIVRDGKIIEQRLKVKSSNDSEVIFLNTPTAKLMQSTGSLLMHKSIGGIKVTTLRIKASSHNITLILKMNANDTVAMVYELVDKYLQIMKQNKTQTLPIVEENDKTMPYEFELFTPFPKKSYHSYEEMQQTLHGVKLVPNATLFLRYIYID